MSYNDKTSKSYSATWYGDHRHGEVIVGHGMAARIGREIAADMTDAARNSDTPVVHVTGNRYAPPLRSYADAEYVWQAGNGAHSTDEFAGPAVWQAMVDALESALQDAHVYLASPDYDNALYVVDMNRWQLREPPWLGPHTPDDYPDDVNDEWEPRPVLHFPGFPPIRGTGPVIEAKEESDCERLGVTEVDYGELDYLPAREHDLRAFGRLLDDEDYTQYDNKEEA